MFKRFVCMTISLLFLIPAAVSCDAPRRWGDEVTVLTAISSYGYSKTQWGDDPVSKEITARTNIALDIEYAGADFNKRIDEMRKTGKYPDLILTADDYVLGQLMKDDALVAFDGYLEHGGENIKQFFNNTDLFEREMLDKMRSSDGKIYGFNKNFGEIPSYYDWYIQIQYRVLEDQGFPKIRTLEDLTALLERYMERHPQTNGVDNIPLLTALTTGDIRQTVGNTAMRLAGNQNDGDFFVDPVTYDVKYVMTMDETRTYLGWLNQMYTKELLSNLSFMGNHYFVRDLVRTGNVLCLIEPQWIINDAEHYLRNAGRADRLYAKLPIYFEGVDPTQSRVTYNDHMGSWPAVITKSCAKTDEAFRFYDYMWSNEAQVLASWGLEGVHYTVNDEGKREHRPEVVTKYLENFNEFSSQTGVHLYNYWLAGWLLKDETNQYIVGFSHLKESPLNDEDYRVLHEYDETAESWRDLWPEPRRSEWGLLWKRYVPSAGGTSVYNYLRDHVNFNYVRDMIRATGEAQFMSLWLEYKDRCYNTVNEVQGGISVREREIKNDIAAMLELHAG